MENHDSQITSVPGCEPPLPPEEYRRLVSHDDEIFAIVPGPVVYAEIREELYESVFDFGCGCGRVARQLMCQDVKPQRYLGIDIHKGMIDWCQQNLTSFDPTFRFLHHDVYNVGLAPDNTRQLTAPFLVGDGEYSLVIAHSVFTHVIKEQSEFYLAEVSRILSEKGVARTTWFFFDKLTFPMMMDFQACLYINAVDPTNAVIYDWRWFLQLVRKCGLRVSLTIPPALRGFQWQVFLEKRRDQDTDDFPVDLETLAGLSGSGVQVP